MVVRNLGYGNDGRGGPGGDAAIINTTNPNLSRSQTTQSSPPTPPAPLPIANASVATADEFPVAQYLFQGEFEEYLIVHLLTVDATTGDEVEGGTNITVAKPPQFRKSTIDTDGDEVNGEIVTYAPDELNNVQGSRKREFDSNGGPVILLEKIDPPYLPEDRIFAAESQSTGVTGVTFLDGNIQARRWVNIEPAFKYFQITNVDKDVFRCQEWDFALNAGAGGQKLDAQGVLLDEVLVAKQHDLRGSTWAGQTIDGIDYAVDGGGGEDDPHADRIGTDTAPFPDETEEQEVLPRWVNDASIIRATYMVAGTGAFRGGVQAMWDTGDTSRAFAEKFVAA